MSIWTRRLARLGRNLKKVAGVIEFVTALLKKEKK